MLQFHTECRIDDFHLCAAKLSNVTFLMRTLVTDSESCSSGNLYGVGCVLLHHKSSGGVPWFSTGNLCVDDWCLYLQELGIGVNTFCCWLFAVGCLLLFIPLAVGVYTFKDNDNQS